MKPEMLLGSGARFERASTGTWLSVHTDELRDLGFPTDKYPRIDMNVWEAVGRQLFPNFELVTIGDDIV